MAAAVGSGTSGHVAPSPASSAASLVAWFWLSVNAAGTVITAQSGAVPHCLAASARSDLRTSADSCFGVSATPARSKRVVTSASPIVSLNSETALAGSFMTRSRALRPM
jgi:hypothetical protein